MRNLVRFINNIFIKSNMNTFSAKQKNTYIDSVTATQIDQDLMSSDIGYSIDQLMEVAGLSVAMSIHQEISTNLAWIDIKKILNISGPGNNGGDGLVASRYLKEFGYEVDILYPKQTEKDLYLRLIKQCEKYSIPFVNESVIENLNNYDLVIDSIFGFSFKGEIRSPFNNIISVKIASVDIPSGWDVEQGNISSTFTPDMLISLTLPKKCSEKYLGIHYLAGRFVPPSIYQKYNLEAPFYSGSQMIKLI